MFPMSQKIDFTTLSGNFSTSEVDTGFTWITGDKIYKKTYHFGALPNNTSKNVAHNLNLKYVVFFIAMAYNGERWMPMPAASPVAQTSNVVITINKTYINIGTGTDRTADDTYVTIFYTKNS